MDCYLAYSHANPVEGSYAHFKDEDLETKRDEVTCLRSLTYKVAELGCEPRGGCFWTQCMKSTSHLAPK